MHKLVIEHAVVLPAVAGTVGEVAVGGVTKHEQLGCKLARFQHWMMCLAVTLALHHPRGPTAAICPGLISY